MRSAAALLDAVPWAGERNAALSYVYAIHYFSNLICMHFLSEAAFVSTTADFQKYLYDFPFNQENFARPLINKRHGNFMPAMMIYFKTLTG